MTSETIIESQDEFESLLSFIVVGETHRRDVVQAFGEPPFVDSRFDLGDSYTWWSVPAKEVEDIRSLGMYDSREGGNPSAFYGTVTLEYDSEGVVEREFHH